MFSEEKTNFELLQPQNMLYLYSKGAFPMADDDGIVNWYMPEIRAIIDVNNYNCPRSLKKFMEKSDFNYKYDFDTIRIIENCANREETWISDELIRAYVGLEQLGHLHSIGVYQNNDLVGGLYGISYKAAFFGESMFSHVSQASKSALIMLLKRLNERRFVFLDVQYMTDHLKMFGAKEINFIEYSNLLVDAYKKEVSFI